MILQNLYPPELWNAIRKNKKYIPRQIRREERLKQFKRYWIPDIGIIKVKDVVKTENGESYIISYGHNGERNGVISYPVDNGTYELLKNFTELEESNFINKKKPIYGAEIKYWFVINNIDFSDENYSGFLDKLQKLKDSTKYTARRNKKKQEYEFIPKK